MSVAPVPSLTRVSQTGLWRFPWLGGGPGTARAAAVAGADVRARSAEGVGRQASQEGPRPAAVHVEQRRFGRVPEGVRGHHGRNQRPRRRSEDEGPGHVVVEEGRRGDVPGQMRDRGGAAARRAEVPRILHQEGDQRSREGPSEVGVARPRVVRVWLDAAAPVVDLGDEVECMLPRQVVLECGHPQRRRRHVSVSPARLPVGFSRKT